jgi:hypothetical protein
MGAELGRGNRQRPVHVFIRMFWTPRRASGVIAPAREIHWQRPSADGLTSLALHHFLEAQAAYLFHTRLPTSRNTLVSRRVSGRLERWQITSEKG